MGGKAGVYGVLAVIAFVVPVVLGGMYVAKYGFDFQVIVDQATANGIAKIVLLDVMLSSIIFWVWMIPEAGRAGMTWWYYIPLNLIIGLCFALALFLYNRERKTAATA
jgi:hypothetical protein